MKIKRKKNKKERGRSEKDMAGKKKKEGRCNEDKI